MSNLRYFENYPPKIKEQVEFLIQSGGLRDYLLRKYPNTHQINSDKLLYEYANELRKKYLSKVPVLNKVIYEKQKDLVANALGTHTFASRNHGGKLKSKHEIRIAMSLKIAPLEMLEMLVVHELAHFKEKDHNKAFYQLCTYMQPDYHQVELDLRLYLVFLESGESLY